MNLISKIDFKAPASVVWAMSALFFGWPSTGSADSQVSFLLIPKTEYHGDATDPARFLPDGEIRLYRPGEYKPRLIVRPNQPTVLPEGSWLWIAEAPGWVTVEAGAVTVPPPSSKAERRTAVGLVVPACDLSLGEARLWAGTERVDFVSLTHGVTYPLPLDFRSNLRIPAGRWLAYSVGPRGLIGITKPRTCSAAQELHLKTIAPPGLGSEEWMVHLDLPEELAADRDGFLVAARGHRQEAAVPIVASASLWNGNRGTYFLFDIPAGPDRILSVRHPGLRSIEEAQSMTGARAREMGPVALRPRRNLRVTLDYRPAREHQRQSLVLIDCGPRAISLADEFTPECDPRGRSELPLRTGLWDYRFDKLDDSQYRLDAEIDEEVVWGLGVAAIPLLSSKDTDPPEEFRAALRESHVYGSLLEEGRPVPGYVRVVAPLDTSTPEAVFPTDDSLTYHLYYFGYQPVDWLIPKEVEDRRSSGSQMLHPQRRFFACSTEGYCRAFNYQSRIVGEGRWDIDLGSGRGVEFFVMDAETGKPVSSARIGMPAAMATSFVDGREIQHRPSSNNLWDSLSVDSNGRAGYRTTGPGRIEYGAMAPGYEPTSGELEPIPGEPLRVTVELRKKSDEIEEGSLVRIRHGGAVARAFFLVVDSKGVRQPCSRAATSAGRVVFPPDCLAGRKVVIIHPSVSLQTFDGDALAAATEITLEPAPAKPARVQVVDGDGRPVRDVAVELRFPEVSLTLNDFYFASSLSGQPLGLGRTSGDGRVLLPTVDPRAWGPVEAVIVLGQDEHAVELDLGTESVLEVR